MTSQKRYLPFLLAGLLILGGCAAPKPTLYQWGSYEQQIYDIYSDAGKSSPEQQISVLEADYEKARAIDKSMPPGFHAHLGYLYFQTGKPDKALQSFGTEKILFPESAVYMDRLIARIKK